MLAGGSLTFLDIGGGGGGGRGLIGPPAFFIGQIVKTNLKGQKSERISIPPLRYFLRT
jgi:hypothetical protein